MISKYRYFILICFVVLFSACKYVAPYPIDDQPSIKIDTSLLGVWEEQTKSDRLKFLVQSFDDVYGSSIGKYETDSVFKKEKKNRQFLYYLTEQTTPGDPMLLMAFLSDVNGTKVVNFMPYVSKTHRRLNIRDTGYTFMKIKSINRSRNRMVLIPDSDTTMRQLPDAASVRQHIAATLDNSAYFDDSLVFVKISKEHRHNTSVKSRR